MHRHAVLKPVTQDGREGHDAEPAAEHAGGQHRCLGEPDDRDVEELPCGKQAGITESGNDGRVTPRPVFSEKIQ